VIKSTHSSHEGSTRQSRIIDQAKIQEIFDQYSIEEQMKEVMNQIVKDYHEGKYKGMYKNILNSNRRSHYANQRKYISKSKLNIPKLEQSFTAPQIKLSELKRPVISARRICVDLDDPHDAKNQYFSQLEKLNKDGPEEYKNLVDMV
jgi:hypothetical protein